MTDRTTVVELVVPTQQVPVIQTLDLNIYEMQRKAEEKIRKDAEAHQRKLEAQRRWREKNPDYIKKWKAKKSGVVVEDPLPVVPQKTIAVIPPQLMILSSPPAAAKLVRSPLNAEVYNKVLGTENPDVLTIDNVYRLVFNAQANTTQPLNMTASMLVVNDQYIYGFVIIYRVDQDITADEYRALVFRKREDYILKQNLITRQICEAASVVTT